MFDVVIANLFECSRGKKRKRRVKWKLDKRLFPSMYLNATTCCYVCIIRKEDSLKVSEVNQPNQIFSFSHHPSLRKERKETPYSNLLNDIDEKKYYYTKV